VEYDLLGWPDEGPRLALDYRAFSYAGKFVVTNTGKAIALDPTADHPSADGPPPADVADAVDPEDPVVGAVAFNEDRTDGAVWWLRYVTVRADRRGEGIGPRLVAFTVDRLRDRGAAEIRIAVNNPYAYEALYRAGFAFTGEETGIAELVLASPAGERSRDTYQAGLDIFRQRGPSADERAFLDRKQGADPPTPVDVPD
jgi:GNAT superfamily N-acetyltransferase